MTPAEFESSLAQPEPPPGIGGALGALWWAAKDNWQIGPGWAAAHELAQSDESRSGAWAHAHLHRIEGDLANAGYWYRQARQPESRAPLPEEWRQISAALLDRLAP
ncbi:hypothetical protein STVA_22310 [Allostella vacuolata]|nr:hypothetical protein STVA_22310 [Stella vacuolata]